MPAPTDVEGLVSATTQLLQDYKENYARIQKMNALADEMMDAIKAGERGPALHARMAEMKALTSVFCSQIDVLEPTYYTLKEVVKEARALHDRRTVRDRCRTSLICRLCRAILFFLVLSTMARLIGVY